MTVYQAAQPVEKQPALQDLEISAPSETWLEVYDNQLAVATSCNSDRNLHELLYTMHFEMSSNLHSEESNANIWCQWQWAKNSIIDRSKRVDSKVFGHAETRRLETRVRRAGFGNVRVQKSFYRPWKYIPDFR